MYKIKGKYTEANVYASILDEATISQVQLLTNQEWLKGAQIAIMPDAHMGKGCTVGTTIQLTDKVSPNLVGVDIGCGMTVGSVNVSLDEIEDLDYFLKTVDAEIHRTIPHGFAINDKETVSIDFVKQLRAYKHLRNVPTSILKGAGSLGGGNHFIELETDDNNFIHIVIHSGSRNLGKQIAEHYQGIAELKNSTNVLEYNQRTQEMIEEYKAQGRFNEIASMLKKRKENTPAVEQNDLAYIEGQDFDDYMHDINLVQQYASRSREIMVERVLQGIKNYFKEDGADVEMVVWETIHNYIDVEEKIVRKGAIRANEGEVVIIPLNSRDGSIIAVGRGNAEANMSGPHGAGRIMSRRQAKDNISVEDYAKEMEGVFSSTIGATTVDEAPSAYKNAEAIIEDVQDLVEVIRVMKPIYCFKSA